MCLLLACSWLLAVFNKFVLWGFSLVLCLIELFQYCFSISLVLLSFVWTAGVGPYLVSGSQFLAVSDVGSSLFMFGLVVSQARHQRFLCSSFQLQHFIFGFR